MTADIMKGDLRHRVKLNKLEMVVFPSLPSCVNLMPKKEHFAQWGW